MGGAVSSGESNDELIDNLKNAAYIKNPTVEKVFRAVDRAMYYTDGNKRNAYKDLAWRDGNLHLSAPCIYSEVLENIELGPGMSFLNLGSGTGYLSTLCGLIMGINGVNHGVELYPDVIEYARNKIDEFIQTSPAIDLFDFCRPEFVSGNCLYPISASQRYDRIYCGAACPEEAIGSITNLLKVGGICIVPINDSLVKLTRLRDDKIDRKALLPVSFATLVHPRASEIPKTVILPDWNPPSLKNMCRSGIRNILLKSIAVSPQGEDQRKKKRKRKQERRRANRLLVVQRRRSGVEGETGFVAVAYSLEDNSSDDDDNSLPNSDGSTESLDSDDMLRHQAQIDRLLGSHAEESEEDMDSLPALVPNEPAGYHIEDNPSAATPTSAPYEQQSNRNGAISSSSPTTNITEIGGPRNLSASSGANGAPQDSLDSNLRGNRDRDETELRTGLRQRYRTSRGTGNPFVAYNMESPVQSGVRGRVQEQYRRARMERERNVEEEIRRFDDLIYSNNTRFANSAPATEATTTTGSTVQMEMMGAMQNSRGLAESSPGSAIVAAADVALTGVEVGNAESHEPEVIPETDEETTTSPQTRQEENWSTDSSANAAESTTDDEEMEEPRSSLYLQPRLVSDRISSNRTSGSTDSGVAVNDSENNCPRQTSESNETGDFTNTRDEENESAISYCTIKITECINTLPIAPTLKSFLNYHRQIEGKCQKQETDLSFLR